MSATEAIEPVTADNPHGEQRFPDQGCGGDRIGESPAVGDHRVISLGWRRSRHSGVRGIVTRKTIMSQAFRMPAANRNASAAASRSRLTAIPRNAVAAAATSKA